MGLLTLLTGFALTWAAGALVLRAMRGRKAGPGDRAIDLGFGFFLGIAFTAFALRAWDALAGGLAWGGVAAVLALAGAAAAAWMRRTPLEAGPGWRHGWPPPGPGRGLAILFLLGILAHFAFSFLELLTQPVVPWDGWTVWVYRAKAWFHAGALAPMVDLAAWWSATEPRTYTIPALSYPLVPSLVPLWAALGLGAWHEALVNLPVLACGAAIALGLAGCLRVAGAGLPASLGAVYLLVSTPLFGAHLSLGGYGDIWMAGFAGLGMTALLCGLLVERPALQWLGLAFLALGMAVKVEGVVWLLCGVTILLLLRVPLRRLLVLGGAAVLLLALAWVSGLTVVELPYLGKVGVRGELVYVPFKGHVTLSHFEVGGAYFRNALFLGSWNLLWPLVAAALCLLAARPRERLARVAAAFFVIFVAMQWLIFAFTTEGAWAVDYTAINRMPLQMLPAVLFLLTMALASRLGERLGVLRGAPVRRAALLGLAGATALAALAVVGWKAAEYGTADAATLEIGPGRLGFVAGGGQALEGGIQVDRYQDGIALLSSGAVDLAATDYRRLRLDLEVDEQLRDPSQRPAFFWRRADQPREVSRITLMDDSDLDLSAHPDWHGRIVEFGFFFVEGGGAPAALSGVRLEGPGLAADLRLIPAQWLAFEPWTQRSVHWLPGGDPNAILPFTALVTATVLLATFLAWLLAGRRAALPLLGLMLLTGWLALDLRWGADRIRQAQLSLADLRGMDIEQRMGAGEFGAYYPFLRRLADTHLGDAPRRVVLLRERGVHRYYTLRAKYQLLPHSVAVVKRLPEGDRLGKAEFVLVLGDANGARRDPRLQPVERDPLGTLYRVR